MRAVRAVRAVCGGLELCGGMMMNLRVLHEILSTDPASIERLANDCGLDPVVALGVAKLLLANDGNLGSLSLRQRQHFDHTIAPLLVRASVQPVQGD